MIFLVNASKIKAEDGGNWTACSYQIIRKISQIHSRRCFLYCIGLYFYIIFIILFCLQARANERLCWKVRYKPVPTGPSFYHQNGFDKVNMTQKPQTFRDQHSIDDEAEEMPWKWKNNLKWMWLNLIRRISERNFWYLSGGVYRMNVCVTVTLECGCLELSFVVNVFLLESLLTLSCIL